MQDPEYFGNQRREMIPFVPLEAVSLLEIGCGAGVFSAGLKADRRAAGRELEVWGVEPNPEAADRARQVLDKVLVGEVPAILHDLPPGRFDCIVMNDVIEHLAEPADTLRALRPLLAPGGRLVASIPNVRYFFNVLGLVWYGRWDYVDKGILDRTHLRFFTRSSMVNLLNECGFQVAAMEGINPTRSLKFKLANICSLGRYSDMRYLQFAVAARIAPDRNMAK